MLIQLIKGNDDHMGYQIDRELCCGCMTCTAECPTFAIEIKAEQGEKFCEIDQELCTECGSCIKACMKEAIKEK